MKLRTRSSIVKLCCKQSAAEFPDLGDFVGAFLTGAAGATGIFSSNSQVFTEFAAPCLDRVKSTLMCSLLSMAPTFILTHSVTSSPSGLVARILKITVLAGMDAGNSSLYRY